MRSICIIQTAFIGDVILMTAIIEAWHQQYPHDLIDVCIRKGNESLFDGHPFIRNCILWDKKNHKYQNAIQVIQSLRTHRYDVLINCQRFASTGIMTWLSRAKQTIGFNKNPFAFLYSQSVPHRIQPGIHEVDRNHRLLEGWIDGPVHRPKLYPPDWNQIALRLQSQMDVVLKSVSYFTMSPASIWFTKQWPEERWIELIQSLDPKFPILLLGSNSDLALCKRIQAQSGHTYIYVCAGQLSLLESAALMQQAQMNYVLDSAPLHLCSAVNAPVTAVYCSTLPEFGFGPLSDQRSIWQVKDDLPCRPCGLHGRSTCPEGHFRCAWNIPIPRV